MPPPPPSRQGDKGKEGRQHSMEEHVKIEKDLMEALQKRKVGPGGPNRPVEKRLGWGRGSTLRTPTFLTPCRLGLQEGGEGLEATIKEARARRHRAAPRQLGPCPRGFC